MKLRPWYLDPYLRIRHRRKYAEFRQLVAKLIADTEQRHPPSMYATEAERERAIQYRIDRVLLKAGFYRR